LSALATGGSGSGTNYLSQSRTASPNLAAPTAQPEIDEDGYSKQPTKEATWDEATTVEKNRFYSSSDSDSEDEHERKIHVEIKPLNNGTAPISASVDELRATVENLSLSPLGGALSVRNVEPFFCFFFVFEFVSNRKTKKKKTENQPKVCCYCSSSVVCPFSGLVNSVFYEKKIKCLVLV
jgi:hypothetical protein